MSWFARSLVKSFTDDHDGDELARGGFTDRGGAVEEGEESQPETPSRGVKEDISELTRTFTRQFWDVASFLAPPPPPPMSGDPAAVSGIESPRVSGIRGDLADIGGKFKSGISMLSNSMAVTEISKIATNFLRELEGEGEDVDDDEKIDHGVVGVTEEVVAFSRNISMHPETWLNFPLFNDDEEPGDFKLSDVQQEHVLAVERLAPDLAALRADLCPTYMSEIFFWKIYFVLLHPRLKQTDAELLSTPQIMEARKKLQTLQQPTKLKETTSKDDLSDTKVITEVPKQTITELSPSPERRTSLSTANKAKEDHLCSENNEEDVDGWLADAAEESPEVAGSSNGAAEALSLVRDEDVSFSDLEEDDDPNTSAAVKGGPVDGSRCGLIQFNKEKNGSSDWLSIDDVDESM